MDGVRITQITMWQMMTSGEFAMLDCPKDEEGA